MGHRELGKAIRKRRVKEGDTQELLAGAAGCSVATLDALERGEGPPYLQTVAHVAWCLGLNLDRLAELHDD